MASGTSPALPSPIPTCPCSSPTTTRALKLKRLAPLVTLATRLIQIARSVVRLIASALTRRCRYSNPAGFGAGGASSFLSFLTFVPLPLTPLPFVLGIPAPLHRYHATTLFRPLELQPALAGPVGQRSDPAVIQKAPPVEHHPLDPLGLRPPGDQPPDDAPRLGFLRGGHLGPDLRVERGGRRQRTLALIVDHLHVDVGEAPEYREPGPAGASPDGLPDPQLTPAAEFVSVLMLDHGPPSLRSSPRRHPRRRSPCRPCRACA